MGDKNKTLKGYMRKNGTVGIRNHILVLPLVVCANSVVEEMGRRYPDAITVPHPYGCTFDPSSNKEITDIFVGLGRNPNFGAVLLVSLGCETIKLHEVYEGIRLSGKPVGVVSIQKEGGTGRAIEKADAIVREFMALLEKDVKVDVPLSSLIVGTECGASDSYSGLSANPVVGHACDHFVDSGATVFLTEVTEFLGAEDILAQRCVSAKVAENLMEYVRETEGFMAQVGHSEIADIAPGNIAGGLSTLEEKSLGCIRKGGTRPIQEVVPHGGCPRGRGLVVMDAPGHDVESMVAMAAGGANLIFFTTGRGTPTGCPGVPVIKVSSNTTTYNNMRDNIDFNAGPVIDAGKSISELGNDLFNLAVAVANGTQTCSERWRCREFAIRRKGVKAYIL
ncbi:MULTISPECIES: UxaA family hydrolase [Aminobacterium]|jgi:altronate dehydratase large subunit|uniref:UxaA family hydrolase n=1 Tax=Aminobacterium TaxID=81466 RepID=UPI0004652242|nr:MULTISPECIES: UxaA family hydrolase [Aminobacterium]